MTEEPLRLRHAPIIEAVVDINCDLPPATDLVQLEEVAKERLRDAYPKTRRRIVQSHQFRAEAEKPPEFAVRQHIGGLQFLTADERQIVQIRSEGYSFNRLAPYGSLDDYLDEIERTWFIFRELTQPVQVRRVSLRFINKILLPTNDGIVELNDYLLVSPKLADEKTLQLVGFLNQQGAVEVETGLQVNTTLAMQPLEDDRLPLIFDIDTLDMKTRPVDDWDSLKEAILSLRRLKNHVFRRSLTEKCLTLFQQQ